MTKKNIENKNCGCSVLGSAPRIGRAGICATLCSSGETKVFDPTPKPVPLKYAIDETAAFGRYTMFINSSKNPPKIPGRKTVIKSLIVERWMKSENARNKALTPSNSATMRVPKFKGWVSVTFLPTVNVVR